MADNELDVSWVRSWEGDPVAASLQGMDEVVEQVDPLPYTPPPPKKIRLDYLTVWRIRIRQLLYTKRGKIPNQIKPPVKHDAMFSQSTRELKTSHPPP